MEWCTSFPKTCGWRSIANPTALDAWKDITPLARNEFICWVENAKQDTTRETAHSPNPGGTRRGHASTLLLAGVRRTANATANSVEPLGNSRRAEPGDYGDEAVGVVCSVQR